MSALTLVIETHQQMAAAGGGQGILDWIDLKVDEVGSLLGKIAFVAAAAFILGIAVKSRGALASVLMAGVSAMVLTWIVNNVEVLESWFNNEAKTAPVVRIVDNPPTAPHPRT